MNKWNKSSNFLPEFEERVLVCYSGGFVTIGWLMAIKKGGTVWNDEASRGRAAVYWQPRPEAPEGDF